MITVLDMLIILCFFIHVILETGLVSIIRGHRREICIQLEPLERASLDLGETTILKSIMFKKNTRQLTVSKIIFIYLDGVY
jgi:hypothetical protein